MASSSTLIWKQIHHQPRSHASSSGQILNLKWVQAIFWHLGKHIKMLGIGMDFDQSPSKNAPQIVDIPSSNSNFDSALLGCNTHSNSDQHQVHLNQSWWYKNGSGTVCFDDGCKFSSQNNWFSMWLWFWLIWNQVVKCHDDANLQQIIEIFSNEW